MFDVHLLFQIAKHSYLLHAKLLQASTSYYNYYLKYKQSIDDYYQNINEIYDHMGYLIFYRIEYTIEGVLHRDHDLPAVVHEHGEQQEWYKYGKRHRGNNLPAIIYYNGERKWYKYGRKHRDNGLPAVIRADGTCKWYKHGQLIEDDA